jgi:hypothetical protein
MSYHDLSESTLTNDERVAEKDKIIERLMPGFIEVTDSERRFLLQIEHSDIVSVKQLFWLRDINNKY